jgi:hypothetical protein
MPISQITGASIQDGSIVVADLGITTFNTGTGNTLTLQANSATGLVIDVTGNTAIANTLSFTGTGARIRGDFTTTTFINRVAFQTSTANSTTNIPVIPNGTGPNAFTTYFSNSDPTNASSAVIGIVGSSDVRFVSGITGSGTYLPMTFLTGGSERLRIDTSGNVGIGTTPVATNTRLTVSGGRTHLIANSDAFALGIGYASAGAYYLGANSSNDTLLFSNASGVERMRLDATGRLGIGTNTPSQLLHVAAGTILASNTSSATATVSIAGNGSTTGTSDFSLQQGTSSEAYVFNRANSFLVLGTNNTERMRIDSSGNVGIGTTNPVLKFVISSGSAGLEVDPSGVDSGPYLQSYNRSTSAFVPLTTLSSYVAFRTGSSPTERMRIDSSGNLLIGRTSQSTGDWFVVAQGGYTATSQDNSVRSQLFAWTGLAGVGTFTNHDFTFRTNNTEKMRITSGGDVGIGTSGPSQKLHVVGRAIVDNGTGSQNGFSVGTTSSGTGTNFGCIDVNGTSFSGMYLRVGNTINAQFIANQGVLVDIGTVTNIPLLFKTNDIERMRLDTSGNLLFNSGYGSVATAYGCRAWVNFDGTGANGAKTIRASGGVSSIVKTATGVYTMNFATAMPDTNYCPLAWDLNYGAGWYDNPFSVGSFQFRRVNNNFTPTDTGTITVAVFR